MPTEPLPPAHHRRPPRLGRRSREQLVDSLSFLLAGGLDVVTALNTIQVEAPSKAVGRFTNYISTEVAAGTPFWKVCQQTGLFTDYSLSLIKIGEQTGRLAENLAIVSQEQLKQRSFREQITAATRYPLFIFALTMLIGTVIAIFVLPNLAKVFSQFNFALPPLTRLLIAFGLLLSQYGAIVVPLGLGLIFFTIYVIFYAPVTRALGQAILFHTPVMGSLLQDTELARFGYLMSTLLTAGLPIVPSLNALADTAGYAPYKALYHHLATQIDLGDSFAKAFASYPKARSLLPFAIQQLIVNGEESGTLAVSLERIHTIYDAKMQTTTKNLETLLEPIILVIVWVFVVLLALAIILPIYGLVGQLSSAVG